MNKTTKSSRLQGKDLMNIGIYSAIYCVIVTGVAMLGYTAIASERSVLLFDEPTSGLDYRHMLQVARLFEKLRNHGKTILVVTHDLEFIEALHANTICLEELQA